MMFKLLLKKELMEIFRSYFYDAKRNRGRSKAATAGLFLLFGFLMAGVVGGMFGAVASELCPPMVSAGVGWLYYVVMCLLAVVFGVFGSVFTTYSGLYLAKDNDLLLSLPIPVRDVMAARLASVYLMGLLYSGCILVPAVIVRVLTKPASAGCVIGGVVLLLLISVFVLSVSCLLGWVVAKVSLRLKNKGVATALAAVLGIGIYYVLYFKAMDLVRDLAANAVYYGEKIRGAAYALYLLGLAGEGDGMALALWTAVVLAIFAAVWFVLRRSFLNIATATGATKKRVYRETAAKRKSVSAALLGKELRRFLASPGYMLNCGFGILLLPPLGVYLLVRGGSLVGTLDSVLGPGTTAVLLAFALCLMAATIDVSAPSVSLEGKSIWIAQSLPVVPWQVLRAKLELHLLLAGVPTLFVALCALTMLTSAGERALLVALSLLNVLLLDLFGMFLGLKMPNLRWTNEMTVIKQSACVMIALFGGWVYAAALAGLYLWKGRALGPAGYLGAACAVAAALSGVLFFWIKTRGAQRFAEL